MPSKHFLYSTNTWLAHAIAERYYGGLHYAWCSPYFRANSSLSSAMPPSAVPGDIYDTLWEDVSRGDKHSSSIARNKVGILNGTAIKLASGVIDSKVQGYIASIVNVAEIMYFRPVLYVIPFSEVTAPIVKVPPNECAHPMSEEFRIEELPSSEFDVLELRCK